MNPRRFKRWKLVPFLKRGQRRDNNEIIWRDDLDLIVSDGGELRLFNVPIGDERLIKISKALLLREENINSNSNSTSRSRSRSKPHRAILIKSLQISQCALGDEQQPTIATLAMSLASTTTLEKLVLAGNYMGGAAGIRSIAQSLSSNTSILHFAMPQSELGDVGTKFMAQVIDVNVTLTHLYLHNNLISDVGAAALGMALRGNNTLQALDVSDNVIGDAGILALKTGLLENTTLRHLFVGDNRFGCHGLEVLVELLKDHNTTIHILDANSHSTQQQGRQSQQQLLLHQIRHYLALNQAGRPLVRNEPNEALLPRVLAKVTHQPDLMYGLIRDLPHVFVS